MNIESIMFLKRLQKQMLWEEEHDNDIQASPRFWVIMDYRTEPTLSDYADGHLYYYNDGDFKEFETNKDIIEFFQRYSEDDYDELVELCMSYHDLKENEIIDEIEFEDLWELVIDHLNEDGFFSDVPTRTESYIVPNTMFVTKKEAKEYLKTYGYNHSDKAHTYAMTALRSPSVQGLFEILHQENFTQEFDYENLAKVTYAYGIVSSNYGDDADLEWEEVEEYSTEILNDWQEYKDIKNCKEGYIIPYAIRKWEDFMEKKTKI